MFVTAHDAEDGKMYRKEMYSMRAALVVEERRLDQNTYDASIAGYINPAMFSASAAAIRNQASVVEEAWFT